MFLLRWREVPEGVFHFLVRGRRFFAGVGGCCNSAATLRRLCGNSVGDSAGNSVGDYAAIIRILRNLPKGPVHPVHPVHTPSPVNPSPNFITRHPPIVGTFQKDRVFLNFAATLGGDSAATCGDFAATFAVTLGTSDVGRGFGEILKSTSRF